MIRRVSGEASQRRARRGGARPPPASRSPVSGAGTASRGSAAAVGSASAGAGSAVAVSIADAIERFDLRELAVDRLEFLAEPLDVAVDRAVIDVNVLAIGRVHQLVAVLDVTRPLRQRFEDQEFGDGQLDRLALRVLAVAGQLLAADQGADALDQ